MFKILTFAFLIGSAFGDENWSAKDEAQPLSEKDELLLSLNVTTGGPYTYSQSKHHFYGNKTPFGFGLL